tara:strand:- start:26 stop:226 length:201 start_codon:yes stop_codon:yes gene_type:complete
MTELETLQNQLEIAELAWEKALIEVKNTHHPDNQIIMDITYLLQDSFNEVKDIEHKIRQLTKNTVL